MSALNVKSQEPVAVPVLPGPYRSLQIDVEAIYNEDEKTAATPVSAREFDETEDKHACDEKTCGERRPCAICKGSEYSQHQEWCISCQTFYCRTCVENGKCVACWDEEQAVAVGLCCHLVNGVVRELCLEPMARQCHYEGCTFKGCNDHVLSCSGCRTELCLYHIVCYGTRNLCCECYLSEQKRRNDATVKLATRVRGRRASE